MSLAGRVEAIRHAMDASKGPRFLAGEEALGSLLRTIDGLHMQLEAEQHNHRRDNEYLLTENKRLADALTQIIDIVDPFTNPVRPSFQAALDAAQEVAEEISS